MSVRNLSSPVRPGTWPDESEPEEAPVRALTREEAQALVARSPSASPRRIVTVQAVLGVGLAALVWLVTGERAVGLSALYGAAVVVVPAGLMARGISGQSSSMSLGASAVGFMVWEFVKIVGSVAMLVLAPSVVQPLSWPALLVAMVLCLKVYWLALRWRGR